MIGLERSRSFVAAVALATACPCATALAMVGNGPHGVPITYDAPRTQFLSIETIVLGRLLASARDTDFSYATGGRKVRIKYQTATIRTAALSTSIVPTMRPDITNPVFPIASLPTPKPMVKAIAPLRIAYVGHEVSLSLPLPEALTTLPSRKAIATLDQHVPIASPELPERVRRKALYPSLLSPHPMETNVPPVRVAAVAPVRALPMPYVRFETRAVEPDASGTLTLPDPGDAAPYIPWAVRQQQANTFRAGPVHGNPHLVPHEAPFLSDYKPGTVVVHVKEKRLYLVQSEKTARVYPIGTASGARDILGQTRITTRRFLPTWTPTPNQRRRDPTLPRRVEAGPHNPLGIRALGLGWRYRLIHGTSDPSSIGYARSDGCIRMLNDDVADLFNRVKVGNRVVVLASAAATLKEWRPSGYREYKPRKRWRRKAWRKKRWRSKQRYASRRGKRKRRR